MQSLILAGIALGAGIHGSVPEDFMASIMGRDAPWWSVPATVAIGVPMCTNAAGIIPIVEALMGKGAALGTVLAFMMSMIALSAPEIIILRKVLKPQLIATFVGVMAAAGGSRCSADRRPAPCSNSRADCSARRYSRKRRHDVSCKPAMRPRQGVL